jgi:sialidase-1
MKEKRQLVQDILFKSGSKGYHTYRIPSIVVAPTGTLLAFCEGRRNDHSDSGDIDMLVRRSTDGGETWGEQQLVWADGTNTCGNPCPVVDRETGTLWLLMTWNRGEDREHAIVDCTSIDTRRVFVTHSDDDGVTWADPDEITDHVKQPDWTWYATGPGAGIQIAHGPHKGRLVIPCDHIEAGTKHRYSHVIISDDGGRRWAMGGRTPQHGVNECEVVELTGNRLLLNMRNYDRSQQTRKVSISQDGGVTWGDLDADTALIEPICQASIRRYAWPDKGSQDLILFSNPAHTEQRLNMTVRLSVDGARSWPYSQCLHPGPSAYSCLAVLPNEEIACLYEAGAEHFRASIVLARFPLQWLGDVLGFAPHTS